MSGAIADEHDDHAARPAEAGITAADATDGGRRRAPALALRCWRVSVKTKGCSGLSYDLSWVDGPQKGDEQVTDKGVTVLVDSKASLFLIGTVMDYEVKSMSAGFTFTNPNEKGRCGCGESFHV